MKAKEKNHMMCNGSPLTQPVPQKQSAAPSQLPPVYKLGIIFHGMKYPFGQVQVSCPDCALSQLLLHILTGRAGETENSLT